MVARWRVVSCVVGESYDGKVCHVKGGGKETLWYGDMVLRWYGHLVMPWWKRDTVIWRHGFTATRSTGDLAARRHWSRDIVLRWYVHLVMWWEIRWNGNVVVRRHGHMISAVLTYFSDTINIKVVKIIYQNYILRLILNIIICILFVFQYIFIWRKELNRTTDFEHHLSPRLYPS